MGTDVGICCYCRKKKKLTSEHVVPKGLYIKDHKIVIPCCWKCNNRKAKNDEYFRLVFAVLKESRKHVVAQKVIEKVKRSLARPDQKGFQSMISASADKVFIVNEFGEISINTGLDVEINRINEVFECITMGLYYLNIGQVLSDQYHAISTFGKEDNSYGAKTTIEKWKKILSNKRWAQIGDEDVFKYRFANSVEGTPQSIWEMKIYNGKSTISFIATNT